MSASLRVGVDARTFFGAAPRGEGRAGARLYRELMGLTPHWRVTLYGDGRHLAAPAGLEPAQVRSFEVPGFRWNSWIRLGLPWAALRDRSDLLHCTSSEAPPWSPCPLVVTVHDLIPLLFADGASQRAVAQFRSGIEAAVRQSAAIIAVSDSTRRDLIQHAGADPGRVHVVHWGADPAPPPPRPAAIALAREALGLPASFLLAFGGAAPRKNVAGTMRGFARIARKRPDLSLVVVGMGEGEHRAMAESLMVRLGLDGRVLLLRYVTDSQLEALFALAQALLYLSLYEGFGLPVLEAMSRGLPVIAANLSSIPEVAGGAALLVDPHDELAWTDAVLALLSDPQRLATRMAAGRARAQMFTWSACAAATVSVLEQAALRGG